MMYMKDGVWLELLQIGKLTDIGGIMVYIGGQAMLSKREDEKWDSIKATGISRSSDDSGIMQLHSRRDLYDIEVFEPDYAEMLRIRLMSSKEQEVYLRKEKG